MNKKLIERFDQNMQFTKDKNHAAACAIFDVIFKGNHEKWNAAQDEKWTAKYNRGLIILANAGKIQLLAN